MPAVFFCLTCDTRCIIVRADPDYAAESLPGRDKTAGEEFFASFLFDIVGLSRQQGFVYFQASLQQFTVSGNLVPVLEQNDVIQHKLVGCNAPLFSIAVYHSLSLRHNRKFINDLFCPDLLDNSDHGVDYDHHNEHGIFEGTDKNDHYKQDDIQKIKKSQCIITDDLFISTRHRMIIDIYFSFLYSLLYFFSS